MERPTLRDKGAHSLSPPSLGHHATGGALAVQWTSPGNKAQTNSSSTTGFQDNPLETNKTATVIFPSRKRAGPAPPSLSAGALPSHREGSGGQSAPRKTPAPLPGPSQYRGGGCLSALTGILSTQDLGKALQRFRGGLLTPAASALQWADKSIPAGSLDESRLSSLQSPPQEASYGLER